MTWKTTEGERDETMMEIWLTWSFGVLLGTLLSTSDTMKDCLTESYWVFLRMVLEQVETLMKFLILIAYTHCKHRTVHHTSYHENRSTSQ